MFLQFFLVRTSKERTVAQVFLCEFNEFSVSILASKREKQNNNKKIMEKEHS